MNRTMAVVANFYRFSSIRLLFYYLIFNCVISNGKSESCVKKHACRCEYSNGTVIDLSASSTKDEYYSAMYVSPVTFDKPNGVGFSLDSFFFHPCGDYNFIKFPFNDSTSNDLTKNKCSVGASVCYRSMQFQQNVNESYTLRNFVQDGYFITGKADNVKFADMEHGVSLVYDNKPSTTTVILICSTAKSSLAVVSNDPANVILAFHSPSACGFYEGQEHSLGTTLVIIFLVLSLAYLVLGALVKRFIMGVRGAEIIPNIAFWRDLPNLIRDGIDFIKNGFKPPPQASSGASQPPNPNSYDSI